jgi:CubicO group peptidase (beta-lactamase class C family)
MPMPFAAARAVLERAVAEKAFPAAVIEVGHVTSPLWREAFGRLTFEPDARAAHDDTVFDLASLTKVIATASLMMRDVERGALGLDDDVGAHVRRWQDASREAVTLRDLLAHCSGLPAHRPFFRQHRGREAFDEAICTTPLEYLPRTRSIYSDLGFMLLGFVLERERPMAAEFDTIKGQFGAEDLQFHPPDIWRARMAPTQQDSWRGRLLVGEVDDENAWALGGAAGHAGLFGTAAGVGAFARHLLQVLDGRVGAFRRDTLETFITRRPDVPGQFFGEMALLDRGPRVATVVATSPMLLLVLSGGEFEELIGKAIPSVSRRMLQVLGGRLREADERLADRESPRLAGL